MAAIGEGLISDTPQDLTANWADYGGEIETLGYSFIGVYADLDINDSKNVQIRARAKYDIGGTSEYGLPANTIKNSVIQMLEKPREFDSDTGQNLIVSFDMDQTIKVITIQIRALTVGATPGQITRARYRQGYRQ